MNTMFVKVNGVARTILTMILIFTLFSIDGQALSYLEKNNVKLEGLNTKEVEGVVQLSGTTNEDQIKILVTKGNYQQWHDISLKDNKFDKKIWLTEGTGNYSIAIMVHEKDREYSFGPKLVLKNTKEINKFLAPVKHVESDNESIKNLAEEIIKNQKKDIDKAKAIFDWVKGNVEYDYEKYVKHVNNNYDNNYGAVNTLKTKKGVCYDYATLIAALGRAVQMETKVVTGKGINGSFEGYHAWNEIFIPDEERWVKLDATFSATAKKDFFDNENFDETHVEWEEF